MHAPFIVAYEVQTTEPGVALQALIRNAAPAPVILQSLSLILNRQSPRPVTGWIRRLCPGSEDRLVGSELAVNQRISLTWLLAIDALVPASSVDDPLTRAEPSRPSSGFAVPCPVSFPPPSLSTQYASVATSPAYQFAHGLECTCALAVEYSLRDCAQRMRTVYPLTFTVPASTFVADLFPLLRSDPTDGFTLPTKPTSLRDGPAINMGALTTLKLTITRVPRATATNVLEEAGCSVSVESVGSVAPRLPLGSQPATGRATFTVETHADGGSDERRRGVDTNASDDRSVRSVTPSSTHSGGADAGWINLDSSSSLSSMADNGSDAIAKERPSLADDRFLSRGSRTLSVDSDGSSSSSAPLLRAKPVAKLAPPQSGLPYLHVTPPSPLSRSFDLRQQPSGLSSPTPGAGRTPPASGVPEDPRLIYVVIADPHHWMAVGQVRIAFVSHRMMQMSVNSVQHEFVSHRMMQMDVNSVWYEFRVAPYDADERKQCMA